MHRVDLVTEAFARQGIAFPVPLSPRMALFSGLACKYEHAATNRLLDFPTKSTQKSMVHRGTPDPVRTETVSHCNHGRSRFSRSVTRPPKFPYMLTSSLEFTLVRRF